MKKLYIVDAVNLLFRSYYAIGPMTNPRGESTNALFGFIRSLYKLIDEFSTNYLVAVFDGPDNKKMRTEIYAEYKSHRKAMPEDLYPQIERALKWCELAGMPFLSIPGVEADDTMGSIAVWAEKQETEVYLCSSDKDLCQLIDDKIFMIQLHKDNLVVDKKKVEEIYGITPKQMIDYLAIVGDASDNIPGLEGFGPKTAASLLQEFGTLDAILSHPEKVSGAKKQETIRQGKEIALLSRRLATIHRQVDFPKDETFFQIKAPQMEPLREFYQEMNFLSLLKEMELKGAKTDTSLYHHINTLNELDRLVEKLSTEAEICLDTETSKLSPLQAQMVGMGVAINAGECWYIPLNSEMSREQVLKRLEKLLSHPHLSFFGHNIKYDLHILTNEKLPIPAISFDTMIASYLVTPQNQRHNLDHLSLDRLHITKIPITDLIGKGSKQISMDEVAIDKVATYCCEDVDCTVRLKKIFEKELDAKELMPVFATVEMPLIPVLTKMERRGIYVDTQILTEMSKELSYKIGLIESQVYALAGHEFNLSSPKQLSKVLFEEMGIPAPKKTATGFSTSADVLEELKVPITEKILEYRTLEKLRSTYVDALPQEINQETHRIHCTFNQSVAATGRLSCQDPNLQNIPVRTADGKKIRSAFKPQDSQWSFISADYSQIELRLLAHLSEDPVLLRAFNEGEDVHAYTASVVFDIPLKEVTDEMRHKAKAVNFGILYGQQAFGLSQGLKIDFRDAASFIETYFKRYPRVREFLEFCKESARQTGRVVTMTGRQRPIPDILAKNPQARAAAERLAINTPLQGTAADLIKIAMIQIDQVMSKDAHMLLQIHDELLFESPDNHIETLSTQVKTIMEGVMQLKVPLEVHISIGKNWGEC
ncbi:MAG TPA: DNA polymerase I [Rhabdochlamydiaceae bacterium]|nr:DNA polymerase I [Rhabdochlamydiaceae bacterium]